VYDITSKDSFKNIDKWIDETKMNASEKIGIVLVGNKCELTCTEKSLFTFIAKRQVSYQEGEAYARDRGFLFFEASAKTGDNVNTVPYFYFLSKKIFETSTANILERLETGEISPSDVKFDVSTYELGFGNKNKTQRCVRKRFF
jgi:GTPase SAR1 family protein